LLVRRRIAPRCSGENKNTFQELIMKYFVAMCLLAAPLALSAAPAPAEAGVRDFFRCHWVKKTTWFHGKKRTHFVKVCNRRYGHR
jgi:hypothetical protein